MYMFCKYLIYKVDEFLKKIHFCKCMGIYLKFLCINFHIWMTQQTFLIETMSFGRQKSSDFSVNQGKIGIIKYRYYRFK